MFAVAVMRPDKYDGLLPVRTRCISTHSLYVIRCRTGSQCKSRSADVTWPFDETASPPFTTRLLAEDMCALVLLDLSSVFDTVDHDTLLTVLHRRFGVSRVVLDRCRDCLCDRTQAFQAWPLLSGPHNVRCSVPQGSGSASKRVYCLYGRPGKCHQSESTRSPLVCR